MFSKRLLFGLLPILLIAVLANLLFASPALATRVLFHNWGGAAVLTDASSILTDSACDTGSGLPMSGGTLDTGPCHPSVLDSTDFGRSNTVGNVHYGNTCPSSLTPNAGENCQFYQVVLSAFYGEAKVATSHGLTKGQTRDDITAQGVSLDVFKTVINTPALQSYLTLSTPERNDSCGTISFTHESSCTVLLSVLPTAQSSVSWSVPNISGLVFFPSSGTILPGGSQLVMITADATTCTASSIETIDFNVVGDEAATLALTCDADGDEGTFKITRPTSAPVISGTPTQTVTHVKTLLASNEIDTVLLATCGAHKGGITSTAQAASSVHYNDLEVLEGGFLDHFSPSGAANQSFALSASSPNVGVLLTFNEQQRLEDGGYGYIKSTGLGITVTNSDGQVIGAWAINTGYAAIHCAKHLPQSDTLVA